MPDRSGPRHRPCWTCRLRRKGCDGAQPVCGACAALEITCHGGESKPTWMDGGARQREMARGIATQIKDRATSRRERHPLAGTSAGNFVVVSPGAFANPTDEGTAATRSRRRRRHNSCAPQNPDDEQNAASAAPSLPRPSASTLSSLGRAWELDTTMTYIDHVFPFLFPFYRPSLLSSSRAWLLSFVTLNGAVSHSVPSLSSFFITVGLKERYPDRAPCQSVIWSQVVGQAEKSFEMTRRDLIEVTRPGTTANMLDKAHIMETIIQLLVLELFVGASSEAWQAHLTPAVFLFEDLFAKGTGETWIEEGGLAHVLDQMVWPSPSFPILSERRLWNSDQAAFRFFAAVLLALDILAGIALRRPPRLRRYHAHLLPEAEPNELERPLGLSWFLGCQNWVLRAISETAVLDEWKRTQQEAGTFSQAEMVEQASDVYQLLMRGFARLDDADDGTAGFLQHGFLSPASRISPTRIWAHATRIYLSVTVSGWMPSDPRIRHDVAQVFGLVGAASSLAELRALAWPLCVAGCLAEPGEARDAFEAIVARTADSQLSGSLREVGKIVTTVWGLEAGRDDGSWDIAACLGVLGTPVLLF